MRYITFGFGILFILLAVLARQIGIDHDAAWGASRYLLLGTGLALTGFSILVHLFKTGRIPPSARQKIAAGVNSAACLLQRVRQNMLISILLAAALLIGFSAYAAWYTSAGLFPSFYRVTNPYVDLGDAFLHGQVALLAKPDPQLVALENPYDYQQREKVPYLWDLSYYKGKYYAYWGPVPALLYAAVQAVIHVSPPDQSGVLVFTIGLGCVLAALLFRARQWFFPGAPGLTVPLFLLAALVNLPIMHILERGQVYETSVIAGQFFLFFGLLAGMHALHEKKTTWLSLAGLGWGLAVATRYNLAISVGVFAAFALFLLWREGGWSGRTGRRAAALLAPLALCGLALAVYNYARFENPFETGLAYQLTLPVYQNLHFSITYFPSNLYVYLFYPLSTSQAFPFFPSIALHAAHLPTWALPPSGLLFDEVFFGVLPSLPIFWLLAVLVPFTLFRRAGMLPDIFSSKAARPANSSSSKESTSLITPPFSRLTPIRCALTGMLALSGLLQLLFLMFYYYGANRFIVDFAMLFLLALIFLAWEIDERLGRLPVLHALFWLAAGLLVLSTAGIALLAGFDITPQLFRLNNPALYYAIANRANQIYAALLALPDSPGLLGSALRLLMRVIH